MVFPLKDALYAIFAEYEAEYSSPASDTIEVPLLRFVNPAGEGPAIPARRTTTWLTLDDLALIHTSYEGVGRVFEHVTTDTRTVFGEFYLHGDSLWHYPDPQDHSTGVLFKISSQDAIRDHVSERYSAAVQVRDMLVRSERHDN